MRSRRRTLLAIGVTCAVFAGACRPKRIYLGYDAVAVTVAPEEARGLKEGDRVDLDASYDRGDDPVNEVLLQAAPVLDIRPPSTLPGWATVTVGFEGTQDRLLRLLKARGTHAHILQREPGTRGPAACRLVGFWDEFKTGEMSDKWNTDRSQGRRLVFYPYEELPPKAPRAGERVDISASFQIMDERDAGVIAQDAEVVALLPPALEGDRPVLELWMELPEAQGVYLASDNDAPLALAPRATGDHDKRMIAYVSPDDFLK